MVKKMIMSEDNQGGRHLSDEGEGFVPYANDNEVNPTAADPPSK